MTGNSEKSRRRSPNGALITGIVVVIVLVGGYMAFIAYNSAAPKPVPIGDILSDLRNFDGTTVTVEGEASGAFNFLGKKVYEVTDSTGMIRVVTEKGLPNNGDTVRVTGIVNELFNIGDSSFTVIFEPADKP